MIEMASIMIGVAGVAQQLKTANASGGGGGSAPSSVSIATSSSGNYNNAITSLHNDGCGSEDLGNELTGAETYSLQSGQYLLEIDVDITQYPGLYFGCESFERLKYVGYIRATGATSYAWDVTLSSSSLSNGCSASLTGSPSTSQDATSSGLGEELIITFGGGRGGFTFPANGDEVVVKIEAEATNSSGTTEAAPLILTYNYQS